ncbi:MAG: sulfotransferase [Halomonas sp.]|uniref:sulfotransferase n=1 Tax=Halomonas sp. TaxID=1486246 RepID=UPI002ACDCDFB|nr:sulfotransferase [Halomonas sp.]MDZ7852675.1 sulfotransferase [Halomonas sp.]
MNEREVRRSMEFYRRCLRRNLFHSGKARVVAKCNPSVFRLPALLEAFPDARIVYVVRRPEESIRSFLSFTGRFVAPLLKECEMPRFFRRKYRWCVELYRRFEELRPRIPPEQLLVLLFDEITEYLGSPAALFRVLRDPPRRGNCRAHLCDQQLATCKAARKRCTRGVRHHRRGGSP